MNRYTITVYRIGFGLLTLTALAFQLVYGLQHIANFAAANYFSFFTIESNLFATIVFFVGAMKVWRGEKSSAGFDMLRGAAVLYMTMTGIIYSLLLAGTDVQTPLPWVNAVLHYIFPVVVLVDWLVIPPAEKITWKQSLWWLVFPIAYLGYSLVRGSLTNWYPYPFLNVHQHGYANVLVNAVFVAAAFFAVSAVIALLPRVQHKLS
ncbi:Pr6Pr family membrane protein [Candidatus Saccharibacteria bacterium]|nr:Pr6Pr family membrane protein [Candidatus Saccharibacteria bacterium]